MVNYPYTGIYWLNIYSMANVVVLLKEMHTLEVTNLLHFTRFLIANQLKYSNVEDNLYRLMYYQSKGEIPIQNLIRIKYLDNKDLNLLDFCYGLEKNVGLCLLLDDFYLDTFCSP